MCMIDKYSFVRCCKPHSISESVEPMKSSMHEAWYVSCLDLTSLLTAGQRCRISYHSQIIRHRKWNMVRIIVSITGYIIPDRSTSHDDECHKHLFPSEASPCRHSEARTRQAVRNSVKSLVEPSIQITMNCRMHHVHSRSQITVNHEVTCVGQMVDQFGPKSEEIGVLTEMCMLSEYQDWNAAQVAPWGCPHQTVLTALNHMVDACSALALNQAGLLTITYSHRKTPCSHDLGQCIDTWYWNTIPNMMITIERVKVLLVVYI